MVSTCPRKGTVSVWQVYITWSALTWRRGWFQYDRCTLVSTHPEKRLVSVWQVYITLTTFTHRREEGDSSMTGVHYTVSTDPQKSRKGLFQYDRCTLHSQCTPREEEVKLVSAWQVYTTWSALTQRRGQFQYDWCTLHGQQSPKEDDGFSMTGVSHTVSAHQEKRRKGWFQDGRCALHGQHSPSEKAGFSMTGVKLHGQGTPREEKRLVSIWQVYTAQFSTHPAKRPGASDCNVCMPCWICMMASRARGLLTVACTSGLLSCPTTDNYYYQHNTKYKNALTKNSCLLTSKHKLDSSVCELPLSTEQEHKNKLKMQWLQCGVHWHRRIHQTLYVWSQYTTLILCTFFAWCSNRVCSPVFTTDFTANLQLHSFQASLPLSHQQVTSNFEASF